MIWAAYPLGWSFKCSNAESDTMFKTTGTINKEFYNEIKKFLVSKVSIFLLAFELAVAVLLSVVGYIYEERYTTFLLIYVLMLVFIVFLPRPNKSIKFNLERMAETTGKIEADYIVYFEEDSVVSQNLTSGSTSRVKYDRLASIKKSKTVYLLFTKIGLFIPIFINCLSDDEKAELLAFLKTHAPQLKI